MSGDAAATGDRIRTLDVRGFEWPLPLECAYAEGSAMAVGETLKVITDDRESVATFKGWTEASRRFGLVFQTEEMDAHGRTAYAHYLRRKA